jgi:polysaccharide deacetylase family protein (PEP-CTERM system associated)
MPTANAHAPFLLSIDLEDVRSMIPNGMRYAARVPENSRRYLEFLARHDWHCTFFTVGDVARRHPELVREIAAAGHEVACHSDDHTPLDRLDPARFREDLLRARDALARAGIREVVGYRAPIMSLTRETAWAHEVLVAEDFRYSSSVIPVRTPLYGWPGHARSAARTPSGLWEIPLSIGGAGRFALPYLSGVYFRILPFALIRHYFGRERRCGRAPVSYLHPYDVDCEQERFMHPELGGSRALNALMYWGRASVIPRLERLAAIGVRVQRYCDFVSERDAEVAGSG